jgi:hypothetical protein
MLAKFLCRSTVLGLVLSAFLGPFAKAASPSSGTVTPSSATVTYTGGPFPNNNQLNQVGGVPVICAGSAAPCDDYALTVSIPSNDGNAYIITVKAQWARTDADFDMTVLDSGGNIVGQSATTADPEVVSFAAVPRSTTNYTVRIVPYSVQTGSGGDTYTGAVSLTPVSATPPSPAPVPNPPPAPGRPRYQSYTPAEGSGLGANAGEPSIGVNWKTGKVFFQSDVQTLRVTFYDQLCNAFSKALWENKSPATSVQDSDPILFTDHQTGRTIAGMLLLLTGRNESSYTDTDGDTWTPSQGSSITSGIDHETIGGGGPFAPPLTSPLYPNAIYYCSQDIATALCALSLDGGQTYGPAVPIYNLTECVGLHGHVKVDAAGAAYVPNESCGGRQALVFSTDNGATWTISPVPDSSAGSSDPSVGIGKAGTLYFGYQAINGHPMTAVGHRSGSTISWSPSHDVGTYFSIANTAFSTVVAGDDDRAAYAFLGSPAPGDFQDANYRGIWHLYVAHTYDSGQSWTTVDATPDDAVQRGCIWMQGGANTCRNLLDFNDLTVDAQGRVLAGYADGCIGPCAHAPTTAFGNSYSALATIARQTGGKRLFRQFDPVEPVLPGAAMAAAVRDAAGVHVTWVEPDSGGSAISSYSVYRRANSSTVRARVGSVAGTNRSFTDTTAAPGGAYFYSVSAANALGETPACGLEQSEVALTDSPGNSCTLPGVRVAADAPGDQVGAPVNADLDILSLSVAEPFDANNPNNDDLEFTMAVNSNVSTLLPNRQWRIIWAYPNGPVVPNIPFTGLYYLGMNSDAAGAVTYEYGTIEVQVIGLVLGNPVEHKIGPATGVHLQDGTIRILIPKNAVGSPAPGDILGEIYGRTFAGTASITERSTSLVDGTTTGTYAVAGNASCAPVVTTVCLEDDSPQIAYSNGWHKLSDPNASAGHFRLHTGNASGDGFSLTFDVPTGKTGAIIYRYAKSPQGGSASAFVDGAARGSVSYNGSSGSLRHPQFGFSARYDLLAPGRHVLALKNLSGAAYVDQICLETATSNAQPAVGPAKTDEFNDAIAAVGQVIHNVTVAPGTMALSFVAQASANVPIQLVLISPSGATLAVADNAAGYASLETPVSANGIYMVKVVNLSVGPVNVWSAATALAAR